MGKTLKNIPVFVGLFGLVWLSGASRTPTARTTDGVRYIDTGESAHVFLRTWIVEKGDTQK